MAQQKRSIIWVDVAGRTTQTVPFADPDSTAIMAALENHSQATVFSWFEGVANFPSGTAGGGEFADVSSIAKLVFTDATGSLVTIVIPAPSLAIFEADTSTVDASAIADVISACVGHLLSAAGNPVTAFVSGVRGIRGQGG